MAIDQINQQDVYAQKQQQNQPKFDQFAGLQKTFQQQQSTNNTTPGAAIQGLTGNVAANQSTASKGAITAGQGLVSAANKAESGFTPTPFTIAPMTTTGVTNQLAPPAAAPRKLVAESASGDISGTAVPVDQGPGTDAYATAQIAKDKAALTASQAASDAATKGYTAAQAGAAQQTKDYNAEDMATRAAIAKTSAANTGALTKELQDERAGLNAAPSSDVIANIGQQNVLENRAGAMNQVLGTPSTDSVAKLTAMFNPGYNASRYGGIDAGIYNQQINNASDTAQQLNRQTAQAAAEKQAAIGNYIGSQKTAATNINNFGQTEGDKLNSALTDAQTQEQTAHQKALDSIISQGELTGQYNDIMNTQKTAGQKAQEDLDASQHTLDVNKAARDAEQAKKDAAAAEANQPVLKKGFMQQVNNVGDIVNSRSVGGLAENVVNAGTGADVGSNALNTVAPDLNGINISSKLYNWAKGS